MATQKRGRFIAFLGGIGSGKTTAMELVAQDLGFIPVREKYSGNELLPLFYKDMRKWAFHSQLFFLIEKLNQLLHIKDMLKTKSVALDTSIQQDLCFLETQKILGNITKKEGEIYYFIYNKTKDSLPRPDILVYLKTNPKHLKRLIFQRGRGYEAKIPMPYLNALVKAQDKVVQKNKRNMQILIIDTSKMALKKNKKHRKKLLTIIKSAL